MQMNAHFGFLYMVVYAAVWLHSQLVWQMKSWWGFLTNRYDLVTLEENNVINRNCCFKRIFVFRFLISELILFILLTASIQRHSNPVAHHPRNKICRPFCTRNWTLTPTTGQPIKLLVPQKWSNQRMHWGFIGILSTTLNVLIKVVKINFIYNLHTKDIKKE